MVLKILVFYFFFHQFLDMYTKIEEEELLRMGGTITPGVPTHMSLPKFLAISALELSIPATPQLLHSKCLKWLQLSGHKDTVAVSKDGSRVQKKIKDLNDAELAAYKELSRDPFASRIVPKFAGCTHSTVDKDCHWIELENLLSGFTDPLVMDIKMG